MNKPAWAAETHIGHHRQINEDRYAVFECPLGQVFVVCDGMGGHEAGEIAATIAIQAIQETLAQATSEHPPDYWLRRSLNTAHLAVYQAPQKGLGSPQMGTTAVVLLLTPENEAWWAHIGDSRLYLLRNGKLYRLTRDHSLVAWYVESGFITPAQAYRHPESNQLLFSLGSSKDIFLVEASAIPLPLQSGDLLLLCSDGLSGYVSEAAISQILNSSAPLSEKARTLVHAALSEGGYDNITVLLVSPNTQSPKPTPKRLPRMIGMGLLVSGIALFAGLGGFYLSEKIASAPPQNTPDSTHTAPAPSPNDSSRSDTARVDTPRGRR